MSWTSRSVRFVPEDPRGPRGGSEPILCDVVGPNGLGAFNARSTHEQVLAALDEAARRAEAGAPQDGAERHWYVSAVRGGEPRLINPADDLPRNACRAWRLDEILEALPTDTRPALRVYLDSGTANVEVLDEARPVTSGIDGCGNSLVEAAAACYLAVLRAAREVAR